MIVVGLIISTRSVGSLLTPPITIISSSIEIFCSPPCNKLTGGASVPAGGGSVLPKSTPPSAFSETIGLPANNNSSVKAPVFPLRSSVKIPEAPLVR